MTNGAFRKSLFVACSMVAAVASNTPGDMDMGPASNGTNSTASKNVSSLPYMLGFNFAGLDFGATNDGGYQNNAVEPPLSQIAHFVTEQGANCVRVPVAWELLQTKPKGELEQEGLKKFQNVMDEILKTDAYAIIDIHSYARYQKKIVGESDIMAEDLLDLWLKLAKLYPSIKVMLGLANEPHEVDIKKWKDTVQIVVTGLRNAGVNNVILIPGDNFTSLKELHNWYPILKEIKNPDGTFDNLIFEAHRYFDSDNSGTHEECVADHVEEVNSVLGILKADNRQVLIAEFGSSSSQSCLDLVPKFVGAVKDGYPTIVGALAWAAGAFDEKYLLVITVAKNSAKNEWEDKPNWKSYQKFLPEKGGSNGSDAAVIAGESG
ncbi:cellulase 3D [Phakopsora pachyrhizi]|uniref:cellulase n=1 Tax=Phakopsora pachyrhizi TaxID=170000 RepID=A0AAV0B345_PHAPC|nr:cellulase 3D [Phakopsora pachyrhizi]CAH7676880.1 cellulase 3D [Phakopsora pachyrhizi]CAH7677395.1 cellulase 3D [Phakopsora pachyrhizi]